MNFIQNQFFCVLFFFFLLNSKAQNENQFKTEVVYKSENLIITQISENSFIHTSFLKTKDYGVVPCNGLIVSDVNETVVFDTTIDDFSSYELIEWIKNTLKANIKAVVSTHYHNDCLGGLQAFHENEILSYAYKKTVELAKKNGFVPPMNAFKKDLILNVGNNIITAKFFGEGHTQDNVELNLR